VPKISPEKQKKPFWPEFFHFFEQDSLLFARVENGVTEYLTKTSRFFFVSKIYFKSWRAHPVFNGEFSFFGRGKTNFGGGGGITSKLASQ